MMNTFFRYKVLALVCLALLFFPNAQAFSSTLAADEFCQQGKELYSQGKTDEALSEFNKALLSDPNNAVAKSYIERIFNINSALKSTVYEDAGIKTPVAANPEPSVSPNRNTKAEVQENKVLTKEEAMEQDLAKLQQRRVATAYLYGYPDLTPPEEEEAGGLRAGPLKITGTAQLSFGVTPQDFIWKRANFDLNEKFKSWRMMSYAGFNRGFNTFDTRIYDSLSVNVDTENEEGFNFHTNVTVDPWSFTGKSNKITVSNLAGTDSVDLQLYYWSNTGYTVNKTVYSANGWPTLNIPELEVEDGKTKPTSIDTSPGTFNLPSMKIYREFQPVRELWLDYTNDQIKFRAFPLAYQDQAYSSDDPLGITNHHIWWQDSPWLRKYQPGTYRTSGDYAPSFTKGYWDDSLSFLSKDSTGKYLTALRGFSFTFSPQEQTTFDTTVATPKHLWQDYGEVDNIISASRLKHYFSEDFMLGGTFTTRSGFKIDPQKLDSQNFVAGVDLGYEIINGVKVQGEVLTSKSFYDMANTDYETKSRGNAYYFSLVSRYPQKSIMDLKYGYDEIALDEKEESYLLKSKFYLSRMDQGFESALSNFHNTRQDTGWSRHIHFRQPMEYYFDGLTQPADADKWGQLNATRIGDGIDAGRNTLGFRFETFLDDRFYNLFDIRNVHNVDGKFIENVVRDELAVRVTEKLTAKLMG
ncbi:MAG: tetratricopeptide repeat protein, partial [Candidatus Omnitrophota bacterium]